MRIFNVLALGVFWLLMYSFGDLPGANRSLCADLKVPQQGTSDRAPSSDLPTIKEKK